MMMLGPIRNRLLVALLAIGLVAVGCGDEQDDAEADDLASPEDIEAPLEDTAGAWYEDSPPNEELPEVAKADEIFPAQFDLVDVQSPVSDQQSRGVCSIFSTVGLMEHLYILNDELPDPIFSEQYLQWSAKHEVGRFTSSSGSTAQVNLQAINRHGIVEEEYWEYEGSAWNERDHEECDGSDDQPTICYTNGHPPEEAEQAPKWTLPRGQWISTRVRDIKSHMYNEGHAVIAGGDFFYQAWNHSASDLPTNREYWSEGIVQYPNDTDEDLSLEDRAGHSFLLVGWDDTLEIERMDENGEVMTDENGEPVTEQGFFIFKNSWGTGSFGVNNPHGDGYGFISYDHVEEHLRGRISDIPGPEHVPDFGPDCADDELECDNRCVPIGEDNCGGCGVTCDEGQICENTQCVDPEGEFHSYVYQGDIEEIPDNDAEGLTTEIEVDSSGVIEELVVEVYIEHPYNGDIQIDLTHPSGEEIRLREADGSWGLDVLEEYEIDEFNGLDPEGTWELTVADIAEHDEGELIYWVMDIVH